MEKTGKCEECKKSYNGTNKLKLTCPGCEKYERCAECFKTNLYKCGECFEDWSEKDRDGNIVGYDQLDYFETPSSDSIYTIYGNFEFWLLIKIRYISINFSKVLKKFFNLDKFYFYSTLYRLIEIIKKLKGILVSYIVRTLNSSQLIDIQSIYLH